MTEYMRPSVDGHRVGEGGQLRDRLEEVWTGARNVEGNGVGARGGIGRVDRLPERERAAVEGIGDGERRRPPCQRGR